MKNKDLNIVSNLVVKGVTDDDAEDIIIEGFANTTDKDRGGDVVLESAWNKGGIDNYLKNPILLAFHDHSHPVGKMTEHSISSRGLHITGRITKAAGDVYELVKSEVLQAFSVGFRVKDADYDSDTDIFVIKDLELHEISVVSVPMNQNSLFSVKKSFENEDEYNEFKNSFIKADDNSANKEALNVDPKTKDGVINLTPEELKNQMDDAVAKAFAKAKAKAEADEAAATLALEAGKTGAEELMKAFEEKMEAKYSEKENTMNESLEGLRSELKEKSEELMSMTNSKMSFADKKSATKLSIEEINTAVLVAKATGKSIEDTDYFINNLKEKAGDHLTGTNADSFETIYSTRMYDEIQDRLVMEPIFTNRIAMTARSMVFPFNPEAGYASWVDQADYKSIVNPSAEGNQADGTYTDYNSSTAVPRNHPVTDISLKAEKLASKEAIGYEEEEDSIIPIAGIVSAAIARRMARTVDTELLLANSGAATVTDIGLALFDGVATLATDQGTSFTQAGAFGAANPVTVADLQATRRKMGRYGHMPSDVVYVVNQDVYFDLLEDPDFRTIDLVGDKATILRGQIGMVNGSPVVVSDSFKLAAIDAVAAVAINSSNYLFGELRGLTTERDKDVLNQKNWIVTTRRIAFNEVDALATTSAALLYPAA